MNHSKLRIGVDSNILCAGILVPWGAPKAVLILAASRLFELILVQPVIDEVERVLSARGAAIEEYRKLIRLCHPTIYPRPTSDALDRHRHLLPYLRHINDYAVMVAALEADPDWFLSDNTAHFSPSLAVASGLNLLTSQEFISRLILPQSAP
jgi:hypothetical protein